MKKIALLSLGVLLLTVNACVLFPPDPDDQSNSLYEPVTMTREELNQSISVSGPMEIQHSGKIYVKDNLLFVGEKYKGFHVFDNSNPQNPSKIGFISVPGTTDIAIKNNVLYLNNAVDMVALSVNYSTKSFTVQKRIQNAFPQLISPDGFVFYLKNDADIIIDYILK